LKIAVPGIRLDDLKICYTGGCLIVSGHKSSPETKGGRYHMKEILDGNFTRIFYLPPATRADSIAASLTRGAVTISALRDRADTSDVEVTSARWHLSDRAGSHRRGPILIGFSESHERR